MGKKNNLIHRGNLVTTGVMQNQNFQIDLLKLEVLMEF